jgi:peptidoglycan/LPS O-acetylase OafA/YrhL
MKLTYYKQLDGIRAIAALMVLFFHFFRDVTTQSIPLKVLKELSNFGQTGVTLFFVLSGFLITRILLNTKETSGYFKNFYVRRILRIMPLYFLFLIVWYLVVPLVTGTDFASFNQEIYYFTYLQNFARTFDWDSTGPHHFWSLAVEEHFYLFWPLVIYLFSKKNLTKIIIGVILFAMLLRAYMLWQGYSVFIFTFTRFDALAIGALLAILELKGVFRSEKSPIFLRLFIGIITLSVLLYAFVGEGNDVLQNLRYLLLSFAYFALLGVVLCYRKDHFLNTVLKTRFLTYTGKISYGLYVYHPLVLLIFTTYFSTGIILVDLLIIGGMSYALAGISYRYFESPFLGLKKYFEYGGKKLPEHQNT